jgi:hypothetical protein
MPFAEGFRRAVIGLCVAAVSSIGALQARAGQRARAPASSTLRVLVVDSQNYPVPGAACVLTPPGGGQAANAMTDVNGIARLGPTAPGAYRVHVELQGFEPFDKSHVMLTPGAVTDVRVALAIARLSQGVTVTAAAPDSTDISVGSSIPTSSVPREVLQRLPMAAVRVEDALPALAGVIKSLAGDLTMKGSGEQASALLVNGLNAVDPGTGSFRLNLPVDSVQGVQVFLHPYSAEYGQFTGGLTTIETRSGGNDWHFELNDFLPDPRFVGRRLVGIADDTPHSNLSGPIVSGRVFLSQSVAYVIEHTQVRGLTYPSNETTTQSQSYLEQLDINSTTRHRETLTAGYFPQRDRYIGLDVFHPQPATPNDSRHDLMLTARDTYQVGGGVLVSSVGWRRFATDITGQGTGEEIVSPTGESGNYFVTEHRRSGRLEASETYNFHTAHLFGQSHDLQAGADVNDVVSRLDYAARPVRIVATDGALLERLNFDIVPTIVAGNRTYAGFIQDRWTLRPNLMVDVGVRYENQRLADEGASLAPRVGFAWSPRGDDRTVVRGGVGAFDDKVPLNVPSFSQFPSRTITQYAPDGATPIDQIRVRQELIVPGSGTPGTQPLPVPRNLTWNVQLDRRIRPWLALTINALDSATNGRYVVTPEVDPSGDNLLVLQPNGRSRYEALEFSTFRTRDRARGAI